MPLDLGSSYRVRSGSTNPHVSLRVPRATMLMLKDFRRSSDTTNGDPALRTLLSQAVRTRSLASVAQLRQPQPFPVQLPCLCLPVHLRSVALLLPFRFATMLVSITLFPSTTLTFINAEQGRAGQGR